MAGVKVDGASIAEILALPDDDPNDLDALDEVWEDSEVLFGPDPNAGCPQVRDMLGRMDTPVNPTPRTAADQGGENEQLFLWYISIHRAWCRDHGDHRTL